MQNLVTALGACTYLREFFISNNLIGVNGVKVLAETIPNLTELQALELNQNLIGDAGVDVLAKVLPRCKVLADLKLRTNQIGDGGAVALANALPNCPFMDQVNLNYNPAIGIVGLEALSKALPRCKKQLRICTNFSQTMWHPDAKLIIQENLVQSFKEDGSGLRVWESARLLANITLSLYEDLDVTRILELGSGTGFAGLAIATANASVLLTDHSNESLRLLHLNKRLNSLGGNVEVGKLSWGDKGDIGIVRNKGPFDMIIGANVLYNSSSYPQLLDTLEALCDVNHTEVLLTFIPCIPGADIHNARESQFIAQAKKRNFELISPLRMLTKLEYELRLRWLGD